MNIKITQLDPFPSNANPYDHDIYNMGQQIGSNLELMYANHPDKVCKYLILVDKHTGDRVRIDIKE